MVSLWLDLMIFKAFSNLGNSMILYDFKLKERKFRLDVRGKLITETMVRHWHSCPERLWMPHSWKCSTPGWMEPWAIWSGGWEPCLWQAGWNMAITEVPSNPTHSVADSVIL